MKGGERNVREVSTSRRSRSRDGGGLCRRLHIPSREGERLAGRPTHVSAEVLGGSGGSSSRPRAVQPVGIGSSAARVTSVTARPLVFSAYFDFFVI